ncbi:hypothetical protein Hanom_Chr17g01534961 [Helianthus anomalus]
MSLAIVSFSWSGFPSSGCLVSSSSAPFCLLSDMIDGCLADLQLL